MVGGVEAVQREKGIKTVDLMLLPNYRTNAIEKATWNEHPLFQGKIKGAVAVEKRQREVLTKALVEQKATPIEMTKSKMNATFSHGYSPEK